MAGTLSHGMIISENQIILLISILMMKGKDMKYGKASIAALAIMLSSSALIAAAGGKADSNGDGILTKAEAQSAAQVRFAEGDANGDGVINSADVQAKAAERFARLDINGDGGVSESEFRAAREARKAERRAQRNGRKKANKAKKARRGKRSALAIVKKADTNGDNAVTQAEFLAHSDTRFAKVDANNDGQITREERSAAREERKATRQARRAARKERRAQRRRNS